MIRYNLPEEPGGEPYWSGNPPELWVGSYLVGFESRETDAAVSDCDGNCFKYS